MTVKELKEKLEEYPNDTPVYIVEHGFSFNAVQVYVSKLQESDLSLDVDLNLRQYVFTEEGVESGLLIGKIPIDVQ